ncbi:TolC family protein, partial [bacterium]|nr:TolC family protein [bacterium]
SEEKEKARLDFWELKVEEDRYRQELIMRLRHDIADVVAYDRIAELAERKMDLLDRRIGMIEQMLRTGERSVVYYTKANMMRAEARNDFARAVQNQADARRKLARRADIDQHAPVQTHDPVEIPDDLDRLTALANGFRPETGLVRRQIELALKRRRMERLKLIPWFNFIEFSWHREQTRAEDWAELSMGIELPLFDWNIGNIRATNLSVKKGEARYGAVLESIDEDVRSAYMLYRDLLLDWKNFRISAEAHIRDAEKVVSEALVYETLRPDEVLEMELTLIDTHRLMTEKRRDLAYALSDLLFALGVERMEQLSDAAEDED